MLRASSPVTMVTTQPQNSPIANIQIQNFQVQNTQPTTRYEQKNQFHQQNPFPDIKKIWDSSHSDLKKEASLLSLILQEQEKTVLLFADSFFSERNRSLDVLIHDGGLLQRIPDDGSQFPQLLLDELNLALANHFRTNLLRFMHKPFENNLMTEIDQEPLYIIGS